ncbi:MAG: homoserine kinase [Limnochordaceae bacterium]|nr:homoserine kinase [Limnochordaceae bacterium]
MSQGRPPVAAAVAEVPASTANLGPGFDTLAMALELRVRVVLRWVDAPGPQAPAWPPRLVSAQVLGEGAGGLPTDASNRVWQAALRLFEAIEPPSWAVGRAVSLEEENLIPLAAGLGSSAAAAVGGLWAANALCGTPLAYRRLLDMAASMEGHADNAAAAALGGLVACARYGERVEAIRVPMPRGELVAVVAVPQRQLPTEAARRALPTGVAFGEAVASVGGCALTLAALTTGRWEALKEAMASDRLHQPYRRALVPGLEEAMEAALQAGAFGAALSGAGPSVLAFSRPHLADEVGRAMVRAFASRGEAARRMTLQPAAEGVRVKTLGYGGERQGTG